MNRPLLFLDVDGPLNPEHGPALLHEGLATPRIGLREGDFQVLARAREAALA
ncbi:hypothetical protein [Streptomyces venezuelae]|uniref:hypothetical protein n=1 Tax=Streptomyces venezuelae TaxID=54571 RepID=UPI00341ACB05